ncbi:SLIT and NTRK-like protein 2 isoform X2 [Denticeps clupeoides]|uniref:SLIT and NTRK-like family, member 2 n=1 Tax=Denticeps clupeoides TaxID=299321 RepID=A0AAY4CXZ6_9TELE|nr:SLIT and NTRK-like protein 2 isoform X2 [Denticeps clupeoides]
MLSNVLLLSLLTVTSFSSKTESRKTSKDICRNRCSCEEKESLLNINCENKGFSTVSQFQPPQNKICQLFLNGNSLTRLSANEFANYSNVTSLHLGNNGLQEIRAGAFNGLRNLRRLHLNNNNLEMVREETFTGLESLEYLQADYNYISVIEAGAFNKLNKLKVLILNDNLLLSLPHNIFRFMLLTHLDLRGNRLKMLPFAGVLEHIGGIMEIQLEENPWNCTCDLIPLKSWLDTISMFVGDIVCETPFRLHGKDITQLIKQDLCPRKSTGESGVRAMQPPSDSHFYSPTLRAHGMPTRAPKASRPPKMRSRPTPRMTSSRDKHVFGPIMVYQTRSPVPMSCPSVCVCTSQNSDSGLNVNCQERKLHNISDLQPRPSYPKKLHLTGNYLQILFRTDLTEYSSLELLHLGNNRIAIIQDGTFENLANLRRLYLNGNYIESLSQALFSGLQSLQYLYLEYNIIKEILPQTFNSLHNLQLLFLNNNLLRSLPENVFEGTMLTRLNLRNNHFSHLPVEGVLDQLSPFIQIDLQENPWDCTCDIVPLKNWMELSSTSVVVNEITCDSPSKHAGRLLRSLRNDGICPETNKVPATKAPTVTPSAEPTSCSTATSMEGNIPEMHAEVPLSVLILGVLVVFILSVCLGAGLFVFVLKRRKGVESVPVSANNLDVSSFQIQYSTYGTELSTEKTESHVYNYIPPPMGQMCQNPIYMQKDSEQVAYFKNLNLGLSSLEPKQDELAASSAFTISTMQFLDKQPSSIQEPELLYQNIAERVKELPTAAPLNYNFCTLPNRSFVPSYEVAARRHNQEHLNKTTLYGTPCKYYMEQSKCEPPLLPSKFKKLQSPTRLPSARTFPS